MFPLAVISDIHSNRWALEAVLEDIEKKWICNVVNLGDIAYGPLDPAGTTELLMNYCFPTVRGNEDRMVCEKTPHNSKTLQFTIESLNEEQKKWLGGLPLTKELEDIFLFHAIPENDSQYLLHTVTELGLIKRDFEEVENLLASVDKELILCGHDHLQNVITLTSSKTVVNPGSVGWQAFDDDKPFFHVVESGSPHARYAVIDRSEHGFNVEFVCLQYDYQSAVKRATENGFHDWAHWLKSGRAK